MEVKDNNAAMLSNYEVFKLLTDLKDQRKEDNNSGKNNKRSAAGEQNLDAVTSETLRYLSQTPCGRQGPDTVKEFLIAMTPHKLTKAETLQLLNLSPRTAVEIHLIVQECEERLCEEQIDELIQTVRGILPGDPQKDAPDGS